jgi:hypothetical protein
VADSKQDWIRDCEHKAQHVLSRSLATAEEVAAVRPRSRAAPLKAWVRYYVVLGGFLQRGALRASLLEDPEADAQVAASLLARPLTLTLTHPPGTRVEVHAKAFEPLAWFFHVREQHLLWLTDRRQALVDHGLLEDTALIERATLEICYQSLLCCWAACTAGCGVPVAYTDERPEIPPPFAELMAVDITRIQDAFMRVNAANLEVVERLLAPTRPGVSRQRPSWSVFFGQLELRMRTPADQLMRDRPLLLLLMAVKLAAPPPEPEQPKGTA